MPRFIVLVVAVFIGCPLAIGMPTETGGQCAAPNYKLVMTITHTNEVEAVVISLRPKDVTVGNLIALACQLRVDFPNQAEVAADIFNDENAARHTNVLGVENAKGSNKAAFIASYYMNRKKGVEKLTLAVNPGHPCGHDIEVDLKKNKAEIVSCE